SIDDADRITTVNGSAARMLGLANRPDSGKLFSDVIAADDWTVINRLLRRARRAGHAAEQTQLESGAHGAASLPVAMTATALINSATSGRGVVLVIEDLSELLAAQRVAAWSEVARRMAHEIKNPLTPIQLSAERIAKSYQRATANGDQDSSHGQNGFNADNVERAAVVSVVDECTE